MFSLCHLLTKMLGKRYKLTILTQRSQSAMICSCMLGIHQFQLQSRAYSKLHRGRLGRPGVCLWLKLEINAVISPISQFKKLCYNVFTPIRFLLICNRLSAIVVQSTGLVAVLCFQLVVESFVCIGDFVIGLSRISFFVTLYEKYVDLQNVKKDTSPLLNSNSKSAQYLYNCSIPH